MIKVRNIKLGILFIVLNVKYNSFKFLVLVEKLLMDKKAKRLIYYKCNTNVLLVNSSSISPTAQNAKTILHSQKTLLFNKSLANNAKSKSTFTIAPSAKNIINITNKFHIIRPINVRPATKTLNILCAQNVL